MNEIVITTENAAKRLKDKALELLGNKDTVIIAIDGRCAAGKTTLSEALARLLSEDGIKAECLHMDDFFLKPEMRTEERLSAPGENVDHERFLCEVLLPLSRGLGFIYRPYRCHGEIPPERKMHPAGVFIIEGAYCLRDELRPYYDYTVFADIPGSAQLERIEKRGGREALEVFKNRWIPLEEAYFEAYKPRERADTQIRLI